MKQDNNKTIKADESKEAQPLKINNEKDISNFKKFGIIKKQDVVNDITSANLLEKNNSLKRRYFIAAFLVILVVLAIIGTTFLILMALSKVQ